MLDAQSGNRKSTPYPENVASGAVLPFTRRTAGGYSDQGGASRFFYRAKVSAKERGESDHPTLKPIALTEWLATLIKPPGEGSRLLIPYAGVGSEVIGALRAGWSEVTGIERSPDYIAKLTPGSRGSAVSASASCGALPSRGSGPPSQG